MFGCGCAISGSGADFIITGCDTDFVCTAGDDSVCVVVVVLGLLDLLDGAPEDEGGLGGGGEVSVQFCIS